MAGQRGWLHCPPTRSTCHTAAPQEGAVLCFDEVMTGFRIAKGCAQVRRGRRGRAAMPLVGAGQQRGGPQRGVLAAAPGGPFGICPLP